MSLRIAKAHEHAIAHVLGYKPVEALHDFGRALLISGNDFAQVLGVHTRRERRNALIHSAAGYFARAQGPFIPPLDMLGVVVEGGAAPDLSIVNAPVWSFA